MQSARDILIHPDTARRGQRASVSIPLSIALLGFAGFAISPAAAQTAAPQATAVSPDAIKQLGAEVCFKPLWLDDLVDVVDKMLASAPPSFPACA